MNYRLAVLTHDRMTTLDEALDAFKGHVYPQPVETMIYADGVWESLRRDWAARHGVLLRAAPVAKGFCAATAALWEWATEPGVDYVFYLEHDFLLRRDLDLTEVAAVLDANEKLAQMALCRGPANPVEEAAGGLVASRPGEFEKRYFLADGRILRDLSRAEGEAGYASGSFPVRPWLEHRSYLTTNPSLMRRAFMVENPWPPYPRECEGRFGADLRAKGYSFGIWGDGSEWVAHVGIRSGHGY